MLNDDDANFRGIANLLEQRLTDDELRDAVRVNRASWAAQLRGGIALQVDGTDITAERAFDLYVNGSVFHSDHDLEAQWNRLPSMLQGMLLAQVNAMVVEFVHIAWAQRNVVLESLSSGKVTLR